MDNIVYVVITAILGIIGFKFFKSNKDTEKEIEYKVEDSKLSENQRNKEEKLLALQKKLEDARKEGKELSPEEIEDYWDE